MAALLNIQNNICYLDSLNQRYRLLYPKLSTLTDEEKSELSNIKKETMETLGQILSNNCNDIMESNFHDKVKLLSQGITTMYNLKADELDKFNEEHTKASNVIEEIANYVCVLENLECNVTLRLDIEKMLFYLKNKVASIGLIDKKLYALEYLRDKLDSYKSGLFKLILLSRKHMSKSELSFEEKQDIFDAFSSISFEYHYDKNHSKVYNEDLTDKTLNLNTSDYICWMENIFVDMLDAVGVKLDSYISEIISLVNQAGATNVNIENYINFIAKKYDSDIVSYYDTMVDKKIACVTDIKNVLYKSLNLETNKDNKYIIEKINKNHRLPDSLVNSEYKKYVENLLFDFEFKNSSLTYTDDILKEVSDIMFDNFDPQMYLDIYNYNSKQKNKQISLFVRYLNELLDDAKSMLKQKYISILENKIEENMLAEYNTARSNADKKKKEKDLVILKRAIENIDARFSKFDEYSYKKYISAIEEKYGIEGLSSEISIRKKSIFMGLKPKTLNKKDQELLKEFLCDSEMNRNLVKNLSYDVIIGNDSIRYEVLSKILI